MAQSAEPLGDPIPVRLTPRAKRRAKKAAVACNKSDQDIYRLLIDIGLEHLERIHYDIAAAIVDRAKGRPKP